MGVVVRQYWVTFFLWFLVLVLITGREARGEKGVADSSHFAAQELAKDCSVYRTLLRKAREEIKEIKERLRTQVQVSQEHREAVLKCAREKGVPSLDSIRESIGAELCGDQYGDWLQTGMRVRVAREDLVDAAQGYQTLQLQTDYQCQPLPIPASLPEETEPKLTVPLRDGGSVSLPPQDLQSRLKWVSVPIRAMRLARRTPRMPMND